jgi:hypothetical protein
LEILVRPERVEGGLITGHDFAAQLLGADAPVRAVRRAYKDIAERVGEGRASMPRRASSAIATPKSYDVGSARWSSNRAGSLSKPVRSSVENRDTTARRRRSRGDSHITARVIGERVAMAIPRSG